MKINGLSMNKVINLYGDNKREVNKSVKNEKKDSLEISTLGKSLSSMAAEETKINSKENIEALRTAVSNGTYKSDSTLTAKSIIDIIKGREV